jgi:hypothetical protein
MLKENGVTSVNWIQTSQDEFQWSS